MILGAQRPDDVREFLDRYRKHWRFGWLLVAIATLCCALDRLDTFRPLDNAVVEARMAAVPRDASGSIVFIGIDSWSLRQVGTWPWPRETYGTMIDRLKALGATEIFLDIDFSAQSNPRSDELFARSLADAGGLVILPVFRQSAGVGAAADETVVNEPLPAFRDHAWPAAVNLRPDRDGRIRRVPWSTEVNGREIPSVSSALSGVFGPADETFPINFSIRPRSVPTYSALDLLEGKLTSDVIEGRSIVIGGHASEFRDALSAPVHGIVDGVILQVLAAETLILGIVPALMRTPPVLTLTLLLGLGLAFSPLRRHPGFLVLGFLGLAIAIEGIAFFVQTRFSLIIRTPVLHAMLVGFAAAAALQEHASRRALLRRSRSETRNSRGILSRFVDDSSNAVVVTDAAGRVLETNPEGKRLVGQFDAHTGAVEHASALPRHLTDAIVAAMAGYRSDGSTRGASGTLTHPGRDGDLHLEYTATPMALDRLDDPSAPPADRIVCCVTIRDVTLATEQRRQLDRAARFDTLTGVLNRQAFVARLSEGLARRAQTVLVMNLHRFRTVNVNLGRDAGDAVLRAFADRVGRMDEAVSCIGRIGGDTFAIACEGLDAHAARILAEMFLATASEPFTLGEDAVRLQLRIGIATSPQGDDATSLLTRAELAMDTAKGVVGEGIRMFEPLSIKGQDRYLRIEQALWTAIENDEMYVLYQPQVIAEDGRIIGAEALVRWTHPDLGAVSPGEFIPIAESNGFIEKLGIWVLERACLDAAVWPQHVSVAVNVSSIQFQRGNLLADVYSALNESGLDPSRLQLEITESLFVEESRPILDTLNELRDLGIVLALDDFGSGFSSLGYLAALPLDKLKLDRAFVRDLGRDAPRLAIVKSIIGLAKDLALQFICEGVETEDQCTQLVGLGCPQIQGYLFGRPMAVDAFVSAIGRRVPDLIEA